MWIGALVGRGFLARRRQQEAELQVERSQKLSIMGQIAAGVAHEIKNPLASIKGAADILVDDNTSADARGEFKEILHNEVRRIDATVTDFLSFARPKETKFECTNMSEIIAACVRQVGTQAKQEQVNIESVVKGDVFVNGDAEKLHQMTLNLVLNAIQASGPGDTVIVKLNSPDHVVSKLEVIDTGSGIKKNDLARAFEPLFTTKASGTGLGLATVRSIVDSHGGEISLTSAVGKGTTATVKIPVWTGNRGDG